jgi:hypothetical protein
MEGTVSEETVRRCGSCGTRPAIFSSDGVFRVEAICDLPPEFMADNRDGKCCAQRGSLPDAIWAWNHFLGDEAEEPIGFYRECDESDD